MRLEPNHRAVLRHKDLASLDDEGWRALVRDAQVHRTTGYLVWAVAAGRVPVRAEQRARLYEDHAALMHHALVIEADAVHLVERCGPDAVVLIKGVAAAHLDHDDPSLRTFQDVDALIPTRAIERVVGELEAVGARRDLPPRTRDWDRRFAKDITFVTRSGAEVDLHRTLVPGPFGFALDLDELLADTVSFELNGSFVRALAPERRALVSALALTAGEAEPRASAALDFAGALRRHGGDVDELIRLAERSRVGVLLARAVQWTTQELGADLLADDLTRWADGRAEAPWERRWLRLYRSTGGTNTATLLGGALGMDLWADRFDYMRGLIRPSKAYRRARDHSARPREWRTGARQLLGRRGA